MQSTKPVMNRIMGLCLLHNELFPLPLCRHVLEYLLGGPRNIHWQDFAFCDPVLYESLRQLLHDPANVDQLELTFSVVISPEEVFLFCLPFANFYSLEALRIHLMRSFFALHLAKHLKFLII